MLKPRQGNAHGPGRGPFGPVGRWASCAVAVTASEGGGAKSAQAANVGTPAAEATDVGSARMVSTSRERPC